MSEMDAKPKPGDVLPVPDDVRMFIVSDDGDTVTVEYERAGHKWIVAGIPKSQIVRAQTH